MSESNAVPEPDEPLRVLELFAGIGGMHVALAESGARAGVKGAYEISEICEKAYRHNFTEDKRAWHRSTIESVSAADLDSLRTDVWLMSPPCQPFTRCGTKKDTEDNRTQALLHLIAVLPHLQHRPTRILLENVIGFEQSESRRMLLETLAALKWEAAEFDLRPEEFGLPNSRPRYYGLFRAPDAVRCETSKLLGWRRASELLLDESPILQRLSSSGYLVSGACPPLGSFLESTADVALAEAEMGVSLEIPQDKIAHFADTGGRYDIHLRTDTTSACLTKAYGRFPRGYGPMVLVNSHDEALVEQRPKANAEQHGGTGVYNVWPKGASIRYLTTREQLRLMGYPEWYCFPKQMPMRERCTLIGNSVNIRVLVWLLRHLLPPPAGAHKPPG